MSKTRRLGQIAVLLAIVTPCVARAGPPPATLDLLSIEHLHTAAGERVVGFEFHIGSARIVSMREVPAGWDVQVKNNPSWNSSMEASALVGAAALDATFFEKFIRIKKKESLGTAFDISGDVVVTRDFVKERRIRVSMRNVTLTPAQNARAR